MWMYWRNVTESKTCNCTAAVELVELAELRRRDLVGTGKTFPFHESSPSGRCFCYYYYRWNIPSHVHRMDPVWSSLWQRSIMYYNFKVILTIPNSTIGYLSSASPMISKNRWPTGHTQHGTMGWKSNQCVGQPICWPDHRTDVVCKVCALFLSIGIILYAQLSQGNKTRKTAITWSYPSFAPNRWDYSTGNLVRRTMQCHTTTQCSFGRWSRLQLVRPGQINKTFWWASLVGCVQCISFQSPSRRNIPYSQGRSKLSK